MQEKFLLINKILINKFSTGNRQKNCNENSKNNN